MHLFNFLEALYCYIYTFEKIILVNTTNNYEKNSFICRCSFYRIKRM